jgi:type IV secretion system protein VirD4
VVVFKAEQLATCQPDGMLDPRLFVCLDEAGNCAAIKKLPQLATTGRGQGIQLLTIWHDEAQLQHRYGHRASTVLNGHRAKLLLSGQADPASLELASKLVGGEAVTQTSETTGGDGRASLTESVAYRRLLPPEALRQLKAPPGVAGVWASAAGPDPPAALVPQPPPGHSGHGGRRRRAPPGHASRRPRLG